MKIIGNIIFIFVLTLWSISQAATISKVKNGKALISLDGTPAQEDTEFYVLSDEGAKMGQVRIIQVKGSKAIGVIIKGTASAGMTLTPLEDSLRRGSKKRPPKNTESEDEFADTDVVTIKKKSVPIGVLVGYATNTMSMTGTKSGVSASLAMTGTAFSAKGFYDYVISPSLSLRFLAGLDGFNASTTTTATAVCGGDSTCSVKLSYLAFEGHALWTFWKQGLKKLWLSGGYSFLLTSSASSNIANFDTSGKTNNVYLFSVGMDFGLSKTSYIPVLLQYGMYPSGGGISASQIALISGYGTSF
ncbi:MAG: hypothetical protein BroJett040_15440 [Oligoflexia bacterium]|nr:MAG: hypothetical protein BroJett040_15440 [Oligoflexia bacterium]